MTTERSEDAWKGAVLDHLAISCMDAEKGEDPYKIIGRIIDWHVAVALDPTVNGGFELKKVETAQETEQRTSLLSQCSREELEAQYGYQSAILAKLIERAGGSIIVQSGEWVGSQELKRLWFSQNDLGDITVELRKHEG